MNTKISLRIHSVKCVDETGGSFAERIGNDEIDLSGFGIDGSANTVQVSPFRVGSNFDDGETKKYFPPRTFVTLDLVANASFPKSCSAGFLLAEIDSGDFGTKAKQVFLKVKEEMDKKKKEEEDKKKKDKGVASLTGAEITIIWTIVKPIIFKFILDKIVGIANDDIFPPKDASITIPSANFTWNGSKTSPAATIEFRGHSGIYLLTYDWELS